VATRPLSKRTNDEHNQQNSRALAPRWRLPPPSGRAGRFAAGAVATPQSAANTMIEAIAMHDGDAVSRLLGSDWKRLVPVGEIDPDD